MTDREEKLEPCDLCGGTGIAAYCKCDTEPAGNGVEYEDKLKARIAELEAERFPPKGCEWAEQRERQSGFQPDWCAYGPTLREHFKTIKEQQSRIAALEEALRDLLDQAEESSEVSGAYHQYDWQTDKAYAALRKSET